MNKEKELRKPEEKPLESKDEFFVDPDEVDDYLAEIEIDDE